MHRTNCVLMSVLLMIADGLIVKGPSGPLVAPLGSSVVLPCSVDEPLSVDDLEVEWKRTDSDILVHLYQDGESRAESQQQDYQDRAHFFTEDIQHGNFSLRLDDLRAEDEGQYTCSVHSQQESGETVVEIKDVGFSVPHILVLILCVSASGSALLLCCLIYCRHQNGFTVTYSQNTRVDLGSSVVLNCYRVKPLPLEDLKVEWRRKDTKTLVHLYEAGKSRAQQDYQDRAHFITDQIQHGNFSLCLDDVKEDTGEYTCRVYSKQRCVFSTQFTLEKDDYDDDFGWFADDHITEKITAKVSSAPLVTHLGSSVVLPCFCAKSLISDDLKVEWRRKDILVHLYEDGESRAEAQQQDYQDRAHFFTEEIKDGNFSLRLDNLRAEDQGQYICTVHNKQSPVFSTKTRLEPRLLDSILHLHLFLVVCPNMIMFLAFVFWGVSEGSVSESVCCCALYLLRPLLLLWAAPYVNNNRFSVQIQSWVQKYSYAAEYAVFSLVVYSALFASSWEKFLSYAVFNKVMIMVMFSIVFVCCFCKITYILVTEVGKKNGWIIKIFDVAADMMFEILPTLQFMLLFYMFGAARGFIMIMILPVLMMMTNERWLRRCRYRLNLSVSVMRTVMLIFILLTNAAMIGLYIFTLEKQTDPIGWGCVMVFLQILWTVMYFTDAVFYSFLRLSQGFHRYVAVYVFGSVAVVLLNSAALITELILKSVNGDRLTADLRFIVFPSECLFVISLLISAFSGSKIADWLKSCQTKVRSFREKRSQQNQNPAEEEEMSRLNSGDPDSVRSQS